MERALVSIEGLCDVNRGSQADGLWVDLQEVVRCGLPLKVPKSEQMLMRKHL